MKLKFTASAHRDLIRLREFIAVHNPSAAMRISQRLQHSIRRVTEHPEMGLNVEDMLGIKDLIAGAYIVRYVPLEDEIHILRIWHGKEER